MQADASDCSDRNGVHLPRGDAGKYREQPRSREHGPRIPPSEKLGSAPNVGIPKRQSTVRYEFSAKYAERIVLHEVVSAHEGTACERERQIDRRGQSDENRYREAVESSGLSTEEAVQKTRSPFRKSTRYTADASGGTTSPTFSVVAVFLWSRPLAASRPIALKLLGPICAHRL